jgi:hypothetical protein
MGKDVTDSRDAGGAISPRGGWLGRHIPLPMYVGEAALLVGVMTVLNLGWMPTKPGFFGVEPNPYWAVILLFGGRYGFRAALLAVVLCTSAYCAAIVWRGGLIHPHDLMAWRYAKSPVLFIAVGVLLGMLVQRDKDRFARHEKDRAEHERIREQMAGEREQLRRSNEELASRIVGASETLPILYRYAKRLNCLDVEQIYLALSELVQEVTKAEQVSVYRVRQGRTVPLARNGKRLRGPGQRLDPVLQAEVLERRRVVTLEDLLQRGVARPEVYLCGPLGAPTRAPDAILVLERIDFLRFHTGTIRLFKVVIDWAASCLARALDQRQTDERPGVAQDASFVVSAGLPLESATASGAGPPSPVGPPPRAVDQLSSLLEAAEQRLFGDPVLRPIPRGIAASSRPGTLGLSAGPDQGQPALRQLLTAELSVSPTRDSVTSLATLLAEVDAYLEGEGRDAA